MLPYITASAGLNDVVAALKDVASASEFSWLRAIVGWGIVVVSVVRVVYPLYLDFRNTRSGALVHTDRGPVSYKRACEIAIDENIRLGLKNEALQRALATARAETDRCHATCRKTIADLELAHATERAKWVAEKNDLLAQLAAIQARSVGEGFGEPPHG